MVYCFVVGYVYAVFTVCIPLDLDRKRHLTSNKMDHNDSLKNLWIFKLGLYQSLNKPRAHRKEHTEKQNNIIIPYISKESKKNSGGFSTNTAYWSISNSQALETKTPYTLRIKNRDINRAVESML